MGQEASKASDDPNHPVHPSGDPSGVPVTLHVYNLQSNTQTSINQAMGFGAYHSGVEVLGAEFAFGGHPQAAPGIPGIFATRPKTAMPIQQYLRGHVLGYLPKGTTMQQIQEVILELAPSWMCIEYHLVRKNCNNFSEAFCAALSAKFGLKPPLEVPSYVNRAARVGGAMCPDAVLNAMMRSVPQPPGGGQAPPTATPPPRGAGHTHTKPAAAAASPPPPPPPPATLPPHEELCKLGVKDLKRLIQSRGLNDTGCLEKTDLVALLETSRR